MGRMCGLHGIVKKYTQASGGKTWRKGKLSAHST